MSCRCRILAIALLVICMLSSCYLRPADELPIYERNDEPDKMAYASFDDTTYISGIGFEYWEMLSAQGKMFYDAMWNLTLSPCISYEPNLYQFCPAEEFDSQAFADAAKYIVLDHPEKELLQFMNMSLSYYSESENYQNFGLGCFVDKDDYETKMAQIEEVTHELIQSVNQEPIKREKYRLIHDFITTSVKYDYASYELVLRADPNWKIDPNINNLYGALVNHLAVCDGISDAFKYLCNQCQLECITVQGELPSSPKPNGKTFGHQWNLVFDEGAWLLVDCTFDLGQNPSYVYFMVEPKIDGRKSWAPIGY